MVCVLPGQSGAGMWLTGSFMKVSTSKVMESNSSSYLHPLGRLQLFLLHYYVLCIRQPFLLQQYPSKTMWEDAEDRQHRV